MPVYANPDGSYTTVDGQRQMPYPMQPPVQGELERLMQGGQQRNPYAGVPPYAPSDGYGIPGPQRFNEWDAPSQRGGSPFPPGYGNYNPAPMPSYPPQGMMPQGPRGGGSPFPPGYDNYNPAPMPSYPPQGMMPRAPSPDAFVGYPEDYPRRVPAPRPMPEHPGMFRSDGDPYFGGVPHTQAPRDVEKL